jgi:peptidoglycan/LPS O-acetylase OafA/YrhL
MKNNATISPEASNFLKGIAIILVLIIHMMSSFKQSVFTGFDGRYQSLAVFLDQLSRLSVPIFVAISGYGLSQRYFKKPLNFAEFLGHRLWKLIPKYLFWCAIMILAVKLIPSWRSEKPSPPLSLLLLLGYADYHLYFVPMILQLYLLFPILRWLYNRSSSLTLLLALSIQVIWFAMFSYQNKAPFNLAIFAEDHEQYLWFTNWIWYFVLGMHLPKILSFLKQRKNLWNLVLPIVLIATWLILSTNAINRLHAGIDPLLVLRFTQYPVVLWASLGIVSLGYLAAQLTKLPKILVWLGNKSYDIYLGHTLVLRIFFSFFIW